MVESDFKQSAKKPALMWRTIDTVREQCRCVDLSVTQSRESAACLLLEQPAAILLEKGDSFCVPIADTEAVLIDPKLVGWLVRFKQVTWAPCGDLDSKHFLLMGCGAGW